MSTDGTPGGLASFPGVQQVVSCHVSVLHGISPSVFTLVTAPQDNFVGAGDAQHLGRKQHGNISELQDRSGDVHANRRGAGVDAVDSRPAMEMGWFGSHRRELQSEKRRRHFESKRHSADSAATTSAVPGCVARNTIRRWGCPQHHVSDVPGRLPATSPGAGGSMRFTRLPGRFADG